MTNWSERFDEQFYSRPVPQFQELKAFISQLLSEVIDEIPDDAARMDLLKQQLKEKYGIT